MRTDNIGILLKRVLPIEFNSKTLNFIENKDIVWYIDNSRKEYYNKFLDFDFSKDVSKKDWKNRVDYMVKQWELTPDKVDELRLLLKDNITQKIYGGCTIFDNRDKDNSVVVAYFIVPEHQNKGIGYELLYNILKLLASLNIKKVKVTIQEINEASIRLAMKLGFKIHEVVKGKKVQNIVMYKTLIN